MSSSSALSLEPKPTPMRLMESRKKFIETNLDSTTSSFSMSSLSSMTVVTKTSTSPVSLYPLPPATKAATTTKFSAPPAANSDDTTTAATTTTTTTANVVRTPPVSINQILIPDKDKDTTTTTTSTNTNTADTSRTQSGLGSASFQQTRRPYAQSPSYEVIIQPRLTTATMAGASAPLARQESSSMSSTNGGELTQEKLEHFNGLHNFEKNKKSSDYGGVVKKRGGVGMCFGTMILISDCLLCHGEPSY